MNHRMMVGMVLVFGVCLSGNLQAQTAARTSLASDVKFKVVPKGHVKLQRGAVSATIISNQAGGDEVAGHRAGYSGVASLSHAKHPRNLFVPAYAGLNFEHIHDGTVRSRDVLFEPRREPMQLRIIDPHTVELYQAPTKTWGLESCHRYQILADGTIELTFECIPRKKAFKNNYVGLFWASYINQPESLDIHFRGRPDKKPKAPVRWIRGVTPSHGVLATHVGAGDKRRFAHDGDFPLTLAFNRSTYRFTEPWYYGVSHKMAAVYVFRPADDIRLTQSPSGGGKGNPAWDFQYFIKNYEVGKRYQFVMRLLYVPYESAEKIAELVAAHRKALAQP